MRANSGSSSTTRISRPGLVRWRRSSSTSPGRQTSMAAVCRVAWRRRGRRHVTASRRAPRAVPVPAAPAARRSVNVLPAPTSLRTVIVAAETMRQLERDREAQPGAAVLPVRAAVGLAERLEDDVELVGLDAGAGVRHVEREPAVLGADAQRDDAGVGELEGVRQQVGEHLLEPLRVGPQRRRRCRVDVDREREPLVGRDRIERPAHGVDERRERHRFDLHGNGAGLDLREVEDVVDQREQRVAGGVDRLGVAHLVVGQPLALVVREQLRQDERAVQRRPQLVRHVREELRLVAVRALRLALARRQRSCLLLERVRVALELRVGRLELRLLLFEPGLRGLESRAVLLQLLVGDPQLLLLRLQLLGLALCRLQQQPQLVAVVDRPDGDGDGVARAVEQRQRPRIRVMEHADLHHALHLPVDDQRRDDQVSRPGGAERRAHREERVVQIAEDDRLLSARGLADEPFAEAEALGQVGVGPEPHRRGQRQARPVGRVDRTSRRVERAAPRPSRSDSRFRPATARPATAAGRRSAPGGSTLPPRAVRAWRAAFAPESRSPRSPRRHTRG